MGKGNSIVLLINLFYKDTLNFPQILSLCRIVFSILWTFAWNSLRVPVPSVSIRLERWFWSTLWCPLTLNVVSTKPASISGSYQHCSPLLIDYGSLIFLLNDLDSHSKGGLILLQSVKYQQTQQGLCQFVVGCCYMHQVVQFNEMIMIKNGQL